MVPCSCGDDGRIRGWRWKEFTNADVPIPLQGTKHESLFLVFIRAYHVMHQIGIVPILACVNTIVIFMVLLGPPEKWTDDSFLSVIEISFILCVGFWKDFYTVCLS